MATIQVVVFDMAGTTVRDRHEVQACFLRAAAQTGLVTTPERVNTMMGWSKRRVFEVLWGEQLGAEAPEFTAQVDQSYADFCQRLEAHYREQPVEPTEGCLELFDWLRARGIAIALTTGFYRQVTDIILQRLGWDVGLNADYVGQPDSPIQVSVTPSEIYNQEGRPAPYLIQKALYKLGLVDPQTAIKIGDTPVDLAAGFQAHCRYSWGVTNGSHRREQLAACPHHGLFDSLTAVQAQLAELLA